MTKSKFPLVFALLAFAAVLILLQPALMAQQEPTQDPAAAQQDPSQNPAATQQDPAATPMATPQASEFQQFSGKIAKSGSKFVLKDTATRTTYMLDDQDRAKQFDGQSVKVTGKLDVETHTIRISSIEPAS